jgi:hypothetical protein
MAELEAMAYAEAGRKFELNNYQKLAKVLCLF